MSSDPSGIISNDIRLDTVQCRIIFYYCCVKLNVFLCISHYSFESGSRLMKRQVVKLITPGTLLEPLDQHANYLLSVYPGPSHLLGLAWIDLSTAAFQVCHICSTP